MTRHFFLKVGEKGIFVRGGIADGGGAVTRMERKGSRALCFEGRERASGSDEPDTEMPR